MWFLTPSLYPNITQKLIFIHASKAGVQTSVEQPKAYNETNLNGLVNVLEAAADHDI